MKRFIPILGVIVAIVGVIVPILWDYYSGKCALEIRIESSTTLLRDDPLLEDVVITYQDQPIKGLTRMDFVLINTGRTPITLGDIVMPPEIRFEPATEIIAATIVSKDPPDLNAEVAVAVSSSAVIVNFDLLNPTDFVRFAIYLSDLPDTLPVIGARIKGVKQISVVDRTLEKVRVKTSVSWVTYPVAVVSLLFGVLLLMSARDAAAHRRARRLIRKEPKLLSGFDSLHLFEEFISEHMAFLSKGEREGKLGEPLQRARDEFSSENKSALIAAMKLCINRSSGGSAVFSISIVAVALGLSFIAWQLWQVFR